MPDLIQFTASHENSAEEMYAILDAHLAYEHAKGARQFWVHLVAAVGSLLALSSLFPQMALSQAREVLLALWGACAVCVVVAAALEWKWYRQEAHLLVANREARPRPRVAAASHDVSAGSH